MQRCDITNIACHYQYSLIAQYVKAQHQYSSEIKYISLSPSIGTFLLLHKLCSHKHYIKLRSFTSVISLYVSEVICAALTVLEM